MHAPPGKKGLEGVDARSVKNLKGIARRVLQANQVKHAALGCDVAAAVLERNACVLQDLAHCIELLGTADAQARCSQVVGAILLEHDTVVPVVGAQVQPIWLAWFFADLETDQIRREVPPRNEVRNTEYHVT